jgi:uncharacterized protein (DUF58 family)
MSTFITQENLLQTGNLEFLAKQVVEGFITGLHKSPFHGFSVEFAEHRLYNSGEATKHIDWKLFARTDKLFVKRFEEETNLRCQLIIDCSSSMFYPAEGLNKIKFSLYAAASLMYMLKKQRDASGLSVIDETVNFHSQCKSSSTHQKLLFNKLDEILKSVPTDRKSNIAAGLHQIAEMIHKRSLVIIFSDMLQNMGNDSELFAALQHLKYNKHEVILFHVEDKKTEIDFDFKNRPYLFVDSETNERLKLFPSQIKDQYIKSVTEYKHTLKLKCAQYKIDLIEAEVSTDFSQILLPFLVKRNKLL